MEINDYALPILGEEAVQQRSADDRLGLRGDQMTSDGYKQSLRSAIDEGPL